MFYANELNCIAKIRLGLLVFVFVFVFFFLVRLDSVLEPSTVIDSEDFCRLDFRTATSRQTSAIICHVICASCYVESWLNPAGSRGIYCAAGGMSRLVSR